MKHSLIACLFVFFFLSQAAIAEKVFMGGDVVKDSKVLSIIKRAKSQTVNSIPKSFNVNWAPAEDPDYQTNEKYCHNKSLGTSSPKVEKLGKLSCLELYKIRYAVKKNNNTMYLIYGTSGRLYNVLVESENSSGYKRYLYKVSYPTATLEKLKIIESNGTKMAFNTQGKLINLLYNNSCFTEDGKGNVISQKYNIELCKQIIEDKFFDQPEK